MDSDAARSVLRYPRVNASMMAQYQDQKVVLVGKVMPGNQAGPGMYMLMAADGKQVPVQMQDPEDPLSAQQVYEIMGTVSGEGNLLEEAHFAYSDNFDLDNYNKMLMLAHNRFPHLFWA